MNFEDVYRGYVICEKDSSYYVGPDTDRYRVAQRSMAVRFTKAEALDYIQHGFFCREGEFVIEDAI